MLRFKVFLEILFKCFIVGGVNEVRCTAKNSRPAPTFHWMIDEEMITHEVENMFDEEAAVFSQVLKFVPHLNHANKTLSCVVQHPGIINNISASTEINISGQSKVVVMGQLGVGELVGVIIAVLVLVIIAVSAFIVRRKYFQQSSDLEKPSVDEEQGDTTEEKQNTDDDHNDGDAKDVSKSEQIEKKGFEIRTKVVQMLASLKPSKEKKMTEDVAATEFEKVELTEEEEKKDEEKAEDNVSEQKNSFGSKMANFLAKLKPAASEKKEDVEVVEVTDEKKDEVELDPESAEHKTDDNAPERRRRGSETPV